jgi:tetratricopeptide (TPR) repeat protein
MQVLLTKSRRNLTTIRPSRNINTTGLLAIPVFLGLVSLQAGCGLLEHQPFDSLDFGEPKVVDAYSRGVGYYRQGLYKSAVKELETVSTDHPRYKRAQFYLAKATNQITEATHHVNAALQYRKEGELFKAKKEFEDALEVYPKHRRVQMLLEALDLDIEATVNYYYEKGQDEFEQKDYESARAAFLEALKADPEESRVLSELSRTNEILVKFYFKEGSALFERGDFDDALKRLERAYTIDSNDPFVIKKLTTLYNLRALKYYREEKLSLAVVDLKRSLEIQPDQEEIQDQLYQIQTRLGLLEKIGP